jgi:hypothetical protein
MGFRAYGLGKGRIEVSNERLTDPYTFAHDAAVILSRRYDLVRLWNGGAFGAYATVSPDGKQVLAQILLYSDYAASETTAWVAGQYRSAKLYTIEGPPAAIAFTPKAGGAEIQLPAIRQYAAIELERI